MPSANVRHMHNTPHLSSTLGVESNDFGITSDSIWNDYTKSIIVLPAIIATIGFIALCLFQLFICCKSLFSCNCPCVPKSEQRNKAEIYEWMKKTIESRKIVSIFFYVSCIIVIFSTGNLYSAMSGFNSGVQTYFDALDNLASTFSTLTDEGISLENSGTSISQKAGSSSCSYAYLIEDSIPYYTSYVDDYMSYVDPVNDPINEAKNKGDSWDHWKNIGLWSVAGVIYISVILFLCALNFRSKVIMNVSIAFGEIVLFVIIISNMVWFIVLILGADFCMSPTSNAIAIAPNDTQEIITFYATCDGVNPITEPLISAYNYTNILNDTLYTLTNPSSIYCPGDPELLSCYTDVDQIYSSLDTISIESSCPPIQKQWDDAVNDATCDPIFESILELWSSQYATGFGLYFLLITGAICYNYFDIWFEDEETSPFNTGAEVSNRISNQKSKGSEAIFSSERANDAPEAVTYSNAFLYDDARDDNVTSDRKFVF